MIEDEHDKISRDILDRINYEEGLRNVEYGKRLAKLEQNWRNDVHGVVDENGALHRLGNTHGVHGHHTRAREEVEAEFTLLRELDAKKHESYWEAHRNGTYKSPPIDRERAEKMKDAEMYLKARIKTFEETGIKISTDEYKSMQSLFGKDVMEIVKHNVDQQLEKDRKQEAERMQTIQRDKQAAHDADQAQKLKQEPEQKQLTPEEIQQRTREAETRMRVDIFELAHQAITQDLKRTR